MSRGRGGKRSLGDNGWGEWGGYMNAKKQKLAEQFTEDTPRNIEIAGAATGSRIFDGVTIHVNGYTVPSSDELKRLMMLHGGMFHHYYSKTKVSHIIATRLPYAKIKELRDEKIVKPEWITDSIKAGKLLPDNPYQLYTNRTTSQGTLQFTGLKKDASTEANKPEHTASEHTASDTSGSRVSNQGTRLRSPEGHSMVEFLDKSYASIALPSPSSSTSSVSAQSMDPPSLGTTTTRDQSPPSMGGSKGPAKAGDANFVSEFYSNSRLHHISTWGAECKAFVNKLQSSGDTSFPAREKLRRLIEDQSDFSSGSSGESQPIQKHAADTENEGDPTSRTQELQGHLTRANHGKAGKSKRVIMHVDMDCFFVSVGLRNRPDLVGKPVAVTHSKGKGMPDANQETRQYEKEYYANKYKQDGAKAMKSRHVDIAKTFIQETEDASRVTVSPEEPAGSVDPTIASAQTYLGEASSFGDQPSRLPGQSTDSNVQSVPVEGAKPQTIRTQSETFNSMAELASCSYEARKAGVKNGMFMGEARKRCPDLQTIPYDFEGYKSVSQTLYETVASYTHEIEAVSCDEMFVDVTSILEDTGATPLDLARVLRQEIKEKTQCNASAGLACNILLARMSTRKAKPNGQFFLASEDAMDFMKHQPVKDIPGVGRSMGARLKTMGIGTCGDLQNLSLSSLQKEFGPKTGQSLYSYCQGIDDRPIRVERERKSVSAEINYGIRFTQNSEAIKFVSELAEEVHRRLTAIQMMGKTVTLKLKVRQAGAPKEASKFMGHGICDNLAKSTTLAQATDKLSRIQQECKALLAQMRIDASDLRGVGIQISRLSSSSTSASSSASNSKLLLDFVKPMAKASTTAPATATEQTRDQAVKDKKAAGTILDYVSKQKSASTGQDIPVPVPGLPQPKKTPLPPLPTFQPSTPTLPSRAAVTRQIQHEQFCLPSPSQLDPTVLAALPADIRQTIERTYEAQKEQRDSRSEGRPSVCTSSSSSNSTSLDRTKPEHSKSSTSMQASTSHQSRPSIVSGKEENGHTANNQSTNGSSAVHKSTNTDLYHKHAQIPVAAHSSRTATNSERTVMDQPSTSNGTTRIGTGQHQPSTSSGIDHSHLGYDPSVLKELPADIVRELMEQEGGGKRQPDQGLNELVTVQDEDVVGPVEALPSFSQIDPSCMEALPSELQKELQLAYQRQQTTSQEPSPTKASSAPRTSPFKLHRRRGRPRKSSPRKGAKQGFKIPGMVGILEMITGVKSSPAGKAGNGSISSTGPHSDAPTADGNQDVHGSTNADDVMQTATKEPVNLCGAVALWDVKALLKEWTTSVEEPGDEDIDHLTLYLNDLILDRNMKMADLVLRAMRRLASRMESTSPWRDAYQMIEDRVQDTVSQIYCSKLKIM
ncbi:DNA repair protein REV1-like [Patiria miniata]|uniref:DNA repair protein REV1 n=1 Tax=Patiria miniata TaxID=46514 RepID=A0A914AEI8_PATMI|nr:DNA repair protein REV1-like [Patiria miniata]